jgi:acyl dehydratase
MPARSSRYWEDFGAGDATPPVVRTIDAAQVQAFIDLLELDVPLFRQDAAARSVGHARRIAPGPVLLSYAMASLVASGWLADSLIALVRMDGVCFRAPLHVGDCVTFTNRFVSKHPSSKAERGYVTLRLSATNQDGAVLLEFDRTFLVKRRRPGTARLPTRAPLPRRP